MKLFISNLWDYRYSKIRTDVCELWFEFGRIKLIMIFEMSLHASKRYGVPLSEIPRLGRWATKFSIRDSFTQSDDNATVRRKWSTVDVVFWNIVAGLTKWESKLFPVQDLRNAVILDYGCNIGVLSYLALNAGARHSVIIDVPGESLDFAASFLGGRSSITAVPVTEDFPPKIPNNETLGEGTKSSRRWRVQFQYQGARPWFKNQDF